MEKIFLCITVLCIFMIAGCTNVAIKADFIAPTSDVTIDRNYAWDDTYVYPINYESVVLHDQNDIDALFENLNKISYKKEKNILFGIAGYKYRITGEDFSLRIVNNEWFYFGDNNQLYVITKGNFDFLDQYEWIEKT